MWFRCREREDQDQGFEQANWNKENKVKNISPLKGHFTRVERMGEMMKY
jgi:hypothetical protein